MSRLRPPPGFRRSHSPPSRSSAAAHVLASEPWRVGDVIAVTERDCRRRTLAPPARSERVKTMNIEEERRELREMARRALAERKARERAGQRLPVTLRT